MSRRTAVIVGCAMGFLPLTAATTAAARTHTPESPPVLLHHRVAGTILRAMGVRWISSGHCARRANPHCTSLEGLRPATLSGLLEFKRASRCRMVISGGTETGHASGRYGHDGGYKLDVVPNRCLDRFVRRHYRRLTTRGDGAPQYRASVPATFAREPSHWDITFA